MAGRKTGFVHNQKTRDAIKASQIVNRLMGCVTGKVEMNAQQVNAAKTLLNKVLPDLSSVVMTGEDGGPIQTLSKIELVAKEHDKPTG